MSPQTIITSLVLATNVVLPARADTYFTSEGDPFLGRDVPTRPAIHAQLENALLNSRRGAVEGRLARLEAQLLPTFIALPKNEHGRLESSVVRYLLHRHFLRRHAWLVNGLAPDGAGWNSTSPEVILEGHVPTQVYQIIREHLDKRGLSLHETAVVAALLENEIHDDAVSRLHDVWQHHLSRVPQEAVSIQEMQIALDMYLLTYILGADITGKRAEDVIKEAFDIYPTFSRTQAFVKELVRKHMHTHQGELHIEDAELMVIDISENYGRWQEAECKDLKRDLLGLGQVRLGYVDVHAFYRKAVVDEFWQFSESVPYLRSLGALDESSQPKPAILIANYMNSPAQYIGASHFYSLSCLDECEPILAGIEAEVGGPYASAEQVMGLVHGEHNEHPMQGMPTALFRLQQIEEFHNGKIPLHGRLFQQWLHHMYPSECAYPHVAGSVLAEAPDDFEKRTNISTVETEDEMRAWTNRWNGKNLAMARPMAFTDGGRWDMHEELLTLSEIASTNPIDFVLTMTSPIRVGGLAGLIWLGFVLFAKTMFYGAIPGTASVALLRVDA